ncbi:aroma-sacti cluster domain-containing protein [Streptomyces sp. NPDC050804]|uniref:aroma-sacti cluster domain-containing protein n=1 Tax=unclassified Streptomyces TaxID=2593676 RepID=UPI00342737B2|nr:hypothetical protein OG214_02895 [Streptomyces sp. NBC_00872]
MNEPRGPLPGPPAPDALTTLEDHGFPLSELTAEQRQVLGGLTPDEVFLLLDIKARLDEVGPEVQAHSEIAGGALF